MNNKHPLNHITESGQARMVDVGDKSPTERVARAQAFVALPPSIIRTLREYGGLAKGNVIETARVAGIMAAKQTSNLIPMCHPLPISCVSVDISEAEGGLRIESTVRTFGVTGVEMEALTAVSVSALTIYDMCKSADKGILIKEIKLLSKSGGKSGNWECDK